MNKFLLGTAGVAYLIGGIFFPTDDGKYTPILMILSAIYIVGAFICDEIEKLKNDTKKFQL